MQIMAFYIRDSTVISLGDGTVEMECVLGKLKWNS